MVLSYPYEVRVLQHLAPKPVMGHLVRVGQDHRKSYERSGVHDRGGTVQGLELCEKPAEPARQ
jgi:hypothetical protein